MVALECQIGPGPEVLKLFSCSTLLSTEFTLLINVGILTFISRIDDSNLKIPSILAVSIMKTCPCNMQQFLKVEKMIIFR